MNAEKVEQLQKEHKEAYDKLLTVKWKTSLCSQGEKCWCRGIDPVEPIIYSEDEEAYVAAAGTIDKQTAEHIVMIHNKYIDNGN